MRYTLGSSRHSSEREREKEQTSVKVLSGGEKCHFKLVWISTQLNTHTHTLWELINKYLEKHLYRLLLLVLVLLCKTNTTTTNALLFSNN